MSINFDDLASLMEGNDFEEIPVELEEFVYSEDFCNLEQLSDYQMECLRAMTQIYKKETLIKWLGEEAGTKRFKQTNKQVILQLGKGSGKDFMSTIAVAYIVYLLLCLRDPAAYYGKPKGNAIDIINIAINAQQAKNVFFRDLRERITTCAWFRKGPNGHRYEIKADMIQFDKNIRCHSGHSQRESWEGYNTLVVILDEISGFALESTSGHAQAKTAADIHKMYRMSVSSRFQEFGKVLLLSFPRFKNDYIQQMYDEAVATKDVVIREHTFILNEDLPEDFPNNKLTINWEEDHIQTYKMEKTFCMKRPTWEMNPGTTLDGFKGDFFIDQIDALSRLACMPPDSIDGFFRDRNKVERAFRDPMIAINADGTFADWFKPKPGVEYFVHVDLAQKHDHCAVALAHVDGYVTSALFGGAQTSIKPNVVVDMIKWWTPSVTENVALDTVRDFIIDLHNRGFRPKLVTFDRWNSTDIINELNAYGIPAELLSVKKSHYQDFYMVVAEERLIGPQNQLLIDELMSLMIVKDKIDHPRSGSKDLSDAVCGAIANAIAHTTLDWDGSEIKVVTLEDFQHPEQENELPQNLIVAPKLSQNEMPETLKDFIDSIQVV